MDSYQNILENLKQFKKRFYLNKILKGLGLIGIVILPYYLLISIAEFYGNFSTNTRTVLFFISLILSVWILISHIIIPLSKYFNLSKTISDISAAKIIGKELVFVNDKLLNMLELQNLKTDYELVKAAVEQKSLQFSNVPFKNAVKMEKNRRQLRMAFIPLAVLLILLFLIPQMITESTTRIVHFRKEFIPPAPFEFIVLNKEMKTFKNENFELSLDVKGKSIPDKIYLLSEGVSNRLIKNSEGYYNFQFNGIQKNTKFRLEGAGYFSKEYTVDVYNRPQLIDFEINLKYPRYLVKNDETIHNIGNLTLPFGTEVTWKLASEETDSLEIVINDVSHLSHSAGNGFFTHSETLKESGSYTIKLKNSWSENKDKINYRISVIEDRYPQIDVTQFTDTVLFNFIVSNGMITDDYGIKDLALNYKIVEPEKSDTSGFRNIDIAVDKKMMTQNFLYEWDLAPFKLQPNQELIYYYQVRDNDVLHNFKVSKSPVFSLKMPGANQIKKEMEESDQTLKKDMEKAMADAKMIKKNLEEIQNKLKNEKTLEWNDKKQIENVLEKQKQLEEKIQDIKDQYQKNTQKNDKFSPNSEKITEKFKLLQNLMDKLMDEETKKLMDELEKLLSTHEDEKVEEFLEKMKKDDSGLEKELDRALELYKQLEMDKKLETTIENLKKLSEEQKNLAEKSNEKTKDSSATNELIKKQTDINEKMEEISKDMEDIEKSNKDLENPRDLPDTKSTEEQIKNELQQSKESLSKDQKGKAGKSQKKAAQKMEEMADQLAQAKSAEEMEMMEENMDDIRAILENLIHVSFEQEEVMNKLKNMKQSDPKFIEYSQIQFKLKDDVKMIEDSIISLAKRVFQVQSFVTREVDNLNTYMDQSIESLREKNIHTAVGYQQFSMTSVNNLALLLNDVLEQMQSEMAESKPGSQMCQKPKKKGQGGSKLSDIQKNLNQKIQAIKQGKKGGKELSEELAKLAAQQEMLRRSMREMEDGKNGGKNSFNEDLKNLAKDMEKTETEIVNKKITEEMIRRQQDILTRLLDAEDAVRERDLEETRESKTATDIKKISPKLLKQFQSRNSNQMELFKTVTPDMTPYYKEQTKEYFEQLQIEQPGKNH